MPYKIILTEKCTNPLFDDYDDIRERGDAPKSAVDDEMTRHSLELAVQEGWVESFSKIQEA